MTPESIAAPQTLSADENATLLDSWQDVSNAPGQTVAAGMPQNAGSTLPELPGANRPVGGYVGAPQAQAGTFQTMPQPTQPAPARPQLQQGGAGFPPTLPQGPARQPQPAPTWPVAAQQVYPQSLTPQAGNARATNAKPHRGRRIFLRLLFTLIVLLAILAGAWFLGVRPYLHNIAQTQLDQAFSEVETQVSVLQLALPPGSQVLHISEASINDYLKAHQPGQLQNLHMTVLPDGLQLDLEAYGFSSTILAVPIASKNLLQVENVRIQGVLGLVMSSDELTPSLNSHLQNISNQSHRKVQKVTLQSHQMDVQIS